MSKHTQDEYDALREKFAGWLLTPDRKPATQRAWAQENNVAETTLSEWRKRPDVLSRLEGWRAPYLQDFHEVVHTLRKKAVGGGPASVQAARLLAELLGVVDTRFADSSSRSIEEVLRAAVGDGPQTLVIDAALDRPRVVN